MSKDHSKKSAQKSQVRRSTGNVRGTADDTNPPLSHRHVPPHSDSGQTPGPRPRAGQTCQRGGSEPPRVAAPPRKTIRLSRVERLHGIMPAGDALFLMKLLQADEVLEHDEDGYFVCTDKYLINANWHKRTIKQYIQRLSASGMIACKRGQNLRFGTMPVRLVRIYLDEIERRLADFESRGSEVPYPSLIMDGYDTQSIYFVNTEERRSGVAKRNSAPPGDNRSLPRENEDMTGLFFPASTSTGYSPHLTNEVDVARANRIREHCKRNGWVTSRNKKNGAHALGVLRRKLGASQEKIDKVLDFIETNNVTKPRICSGAQLANPKVWNWLEELVERGISNGSHSKNNNIGVCATQIAKRLLSRYDWGASADQLAACVQLTIDRMAEFRDRCRKVNSPKVAADVAARIAKHLTAPVVEHLAEVWVADLNALAGAWKGWDGNLMKLAWDFRREPCQRYLRDFTESYFGVHNDAKRQQPFDVFLKEYRRAG